MCRKLELLDWMFRFTKNFTISWARLPLISEDTSNRISHSLNAVESAAPQTSQSAFVISSISITSHHQRHASNPNMSILHQSPPRCATTQPYHSKSGWCSRSVSNPSKKKAAVSKLHTHLKHILYTSSPSFPSV